MIKVSNLISDRSGRAVCNQFVIKTDDAVVFQSYDTTIAKKVNGNVYVRNDALDFSMTTSKYLYNFLREYCGKYCIRTKANFNDCVTRGEINLVAPSMME